MKTFAPGKLILSGEHAVVYGHPALAMAVNRYAMTHISPHLFPGIFFHLSDLSYQKRLSLAFLDNLKKRIKRKYHCFRQGDFKIRDVLQKPVELAQFALTLFFEALNIKLTQGIKLHLQSDIPMGCGMGSSAATVLSIAYAIARHLHLDMPADILFRLGLEAENMQHGHSSGLDVRISLHGGCLYTEQGEVYARPIPQVPMFIVNTGTPETSTGECVMRAAPFFQASHMGDDFAAVTQALDQALLNNCLAEVIYLIDQNHQLLSHIGVVPPLVQQFVGEVKQLGGAAKICGAGAVAGNKSGIVWVVADHAEALTELCHQYHYTILPVTGESRGVHAV